MDKKKDETSEKAPAHTTRDSVSPTKDQEDHKHNRGEAREGISKNVSSKLELIKILSVLLLGTLIPLVTKNYLICLAIALFSGLLLSWPSRAALTSQKATWVALSTTLFAVAAGAGLLIVGSIFWIVASSVSLWHQEQLSSQALQEQSLLKLAQTIAKNDYGLDLVRQDQRTSWLYTIFLLRGSTPAAMDYGPGFCELTVEKDNLLWMYFVKGIEDRDNDAWEKGMVIHELGHCVDVSRDLPPKNTQGWKTHSLAPMAERNRKSDVQGFIDASNDESSKKWREAFADVFAIGYWKLTTNADQESRLVKALLEKRRADKGSHHTTCWIKVAQGESPPSDRKNLRQWADSIRAKSQCLTEDQPQKKNKTNPT